MNQTDLPFYVPVGHDHECQTLPHAVTAKARDHPGGETPVHRHPRAQFLYAGSGIMRVETHVGCWVVPPVRGVWIPAETDHKVVMLSPVEMRTLYVRPDAAEGLPGHCCLVEVRPLLRALILALFEEPLAYDRHGRGGQIAALILSELRFLNIPALYLPMPSEPRLLELCRALLVRPGAQETLEALADKHASSSRTLARLFLRETGMSFRQWRQQARLIEALDLLANGVPVALVSERLGYRSASAFAAMFKRALGTEPRRYFSTSE